MRFVVNAKELSRALSSSLEIANKNTLKEFEAANKITIEAKKDKIISSASGGTASIVSSINDNYYGSLNYKCEEEGIVTVDSTIMLESLLVFSSSDVKVSFSTGQLFISLLEDDDIVQPVPTFEGKIKVPQIAESFNKEIKVNREIFIEGINKVSFAIAFEEKMRNYMCMVFESSQDNVRFSAGSGSRFTVSNVSGKNIGTKSKTQIIFPKNNISNISKILSDASDTNIVIKYADADGEKGSPEQIMIEFGGTNLCILGIDSSINYPDMDSIINFDYSNKVYSNIEDWRMAVAGISATMHVDSDNIYNTEVVADTEKGYFRTETKTLLKAKNKVKFTDDEKSITDNDNPWFRCNSLYLKEMISKANKTGEVSIHFENQQKLESLPDDEQRMKPVLVKFSDNPNETKETIENFYMFFSVSTK